MKHLVIPDTQIRDADDLTFLRYIGQYIVDKKPDKIICLGDFADMPSLSSYDVGKKQFEGRRYKADIEAAHEGMETLLGPIKEHNAKMRRTKHSSYVPEYYMLYGNHEERILRAVNGDPKLDGTIGLEDLRYREYGWNVIPFLQPIVLDGVAYCHYFTTGMLGRPCSSAQIQLVKKHMSCISGHQQGLQVATSYRADGRRLTSIIAGSCLTPDHKVLTSDLRYIPLEYAYPGTKLVSFEEEVTDKRSRRYVEGTVLNHTLDVAEIYEVLLQSGQTFKVTSDHNWFVKTGSKYHWVQTQNLRKGTNIPKLLDTWELSDTREAGWLAGIYDGEGSLSQRLTSGGEVQQLSVSQNGGLVLKKIQNTLAAYGFTSGKYQANGRNCFQTRLVGGTTEIARFLGTIYPHRLVDKFSPNFMGRINCPDSRNDKVISITPIGKGEIVRIEIDAGTMIVEGYGHHNCYEHNEDYLGPQGNNHWRGLLVLHEVNDGEFDMMPVSLGYLRKKYEPRN